MPRKILRNRTLISLRTQMGVTMHGYLLATDKRQVDGAIEAMASVAEKLQIPHLNIWLSTGPTTPDKEIEAIIRRNSKDGARIIDDHKGGNKVSFIAWIMPTDDPDNETLMAWH